MRAPPEPNQDARFKTAVLLFDGEIGRSRAHVSAYSRGFFDFIQVGSTLLVGYAQCEGSRVGRMGETRKGVRESATVTLLCDLQ